MDNQRQLIINQIKKAMDGRKQRWLSLEVRIAESELSKKIRGSIAFTEAEIKRIEARLNCQIKRNPHANY